MIFISGRHLTYVTFLAKKFGGLVRIRPSEVLISDPTLADLIAVKFDLPKPTAVYKMLKMPYLDLDSTLTFENADKARWDHRKRRRLVFPAFSPTTLDKVEPLLQTHIGDFLERVKMDMGKDGERLVEFCEIYDSLTLDVILDLAFDMHPRISSKPSKTTSSDPLAASNIRTSVTRALRYAGMRAALFILGIDSAILNSLPLDTTGRDALSRVQKFTETIVAARRAASETSEKRSHLLQALCDSTDEDTGLRLTEREVVAEATLFLIAGNETTSASLAFATGFN
jgi:cytochrome P450